MRETKTCSKCRSTHPLTAEHFKPNKSRPGGWEYWCRACFNAFYRANSKARPEQRREKERKYRERNPEAYAAKQRRHYESARARGADWVKYNPERERERDRRRWRDDERRREWDRERWKRRREAYNERARERYRIDPWPKRLSELRHRMLRIKAPGQFTRAELYARLDYWGWRCRYCRCELDAKALTLDHRIPLYRGGTNWLANIVPACKPCNSSKRIKTESEYFEWRARNGLQ